ncbi:hypothetical protein AB833_28810 [Chromatiales bacterium (ex Bugula neritina AB1)]|nr:hypothetical protein AB833_28810 [Chromatiales bacterium (ex Bugula neritina AB1)]
MQIIRITASKTLSEQIEKLELAKDIKLYIYKLYGGNKIQCHHEAACPGFMFQLAGDVQFTEAEFDTDPDKWKLQEKLGAFSARFYS